MPAVDIIDEMYVVASVDVVRQACCDEARWRRWFPELTLQAYADRGRKGVRWNVSGALVGTAEVWLEEYGDGVIVHTYVRAEPAEARGSARRLAGWTRRTYALPLKRHLMTLKFELEGDRVLGTARVPLAERVVSPPIDPTSRHRGQRRWRTRRPRASRSRPSPPR